MALPGHPREERSQLLADRLAGVGAYPLLERGRLEPSSSKLLDRIIPTIEEVLAAGGTLPPEAPSESVPPAIPNPESPGDAGHRSR